MSRRAARAQRAAATQSTFWGTTAAESAPSAPEVEAAGLESAPVASAPQTEAAVAEASLVSSAHAAPVAEKTTDAAPLTRASRRARTAPTPVAEPEAAHIEAARVADVEAAQIADVEAAHIEAARVADAASETVVPAAAIAWAAATAAATAEAQHVAVVEPVLAPAEPFELIEPVAGEPSAERDGAEAHDEPRAGASGVDEFEAAARLFSFTGETPVQSAAAEPGPADTPADEPEVAAEPVAHVAPRRRRHVARQLTTASFSVGVMGIVGLLTVGMTTPADAVAAVTGAEPTSLVASAAGTDVAVESDDIQAYVAPGDIENATLERDENYSTVSMGEIAAEEGITNYSNFFVNDPNAAIQWPFKVGVPITYGFGMRSGRMHEGADFVPGQGADVQAIADGTVRIATNSGGAYGVTVVIDHIIDGELVSSRYAHMLYGSLKVVPGQQVTVGTILGNTGNTGRSYGAHTHFEILQGGTTAIDPITWLRTYAGRESLDHW